MQRGSTFLLAHPEAAFQGEAPGEIFAAGGVVDVFPFRDFDLAGCAAFHPQGTGHEVRTVQGAVDGHGEAEAARAAGEERAPRFRPPLSDERQPFRPAHRFVRRGLLPPLGGAQEQGELRAPAADTLKGMQERLDDLISAVAAAFPGSRIECVKCGFGLPIQADPALAQQLGRAAAAAGLTLQPQFDFKASEDASLLIKAVQDHGGRGVYSVFGAHLAAGPHQSTFDFNEDALLGAIKTYLTLFTGAAGAAA